MTDIKKPAHLLVSYPDHMFSGQINDDVIDFMRNAETLKITAYKNRAHVKVSAKDLKMGDMSIFLPSTMDISDNPVISDPFNYVRAEIHIDDLGDHWTTIIQGLNRNDSLGLNVSCRIIEDTISGRNPMFEESIKLVVNDSIGVLSVSLIAWHIASMSRPSSFWFRHIDL